MSPVRACAVVAALDRAAGTSRPGVWPADAALDAAEKALYRVTRALEEDPAYLPPFLTVIRAAVEAVKLQQMIATQAIERLERASASGQNTGALEELTRRLDRMAEARAAAEAALAAQQRPPDAAPDAPNAQ